jgi:asparagine synthetase A
MSVTLSELLSINVDVLDWSIIVIITQRNTRETLINAVSFIYRSRFVDPIFCLV